MCTVVVLNRPGHSWPVLIAANRDEMIDRSWDPPARHWPDRPYTIAGLDRSAGGSWMGVNDEGLVACVLNRRGSLGPAPGKRSRGELVLEALEQVDAELAADMLRHVDPLAYRPFNMLLADNEDAFVVHHRGEGARIEVQRVPPGLSILTAVDLNDPVDPRVRAWRPAFRAAAVPEPERGDWAAWERLLASRLHDPLEGPLAAMLIAPDRGYGTTSSSLVALPGRENVDAERVWRFCARQPGDGQWRAVSLA